MWPRKPVSTTYVDNSNNVSSLEDIMYTNDVSIGFSNANFGGNNTFRFSRTYQFLNGVIVNFSINYPAAGENIVHDEYFAYSLIRRLRWTAGGTELLTLGGESLVPMILDQCESFQKKCIVLEEAGVRKVLTTSANFTSKTINYSIVLPLPFSSLNTKKFDNIFKSFPLHMLSEPLELQIEIREQNEIATNATTATVLPTIGSALLQFQYGKIGNPEQLKRGVYKYPFTSVFSNNFTYNRNNVVSGVGTAVVELNGFRRAEVNMIQIAAVRNSFQRNQGLKLANIKLTFNGQVIWKCEGNDQLWDLMYNSQPCVHGYRKYGLRNVTLTNNANLNIIERNKLKLAPADIDALPAKAFVEFYGHSTNTDAEAGENGLHYYYNIPISEILQKYAGCGHVLGADFSKQSIQLQFDAPANGILQAAYYYKSFYQFDNEQALLVY